MRVIYWLNPLQESSCPTHAIVCVWLFSVQHTPQHLLQSYLIVSSSPCITCAGMIRRWPSPKRQKQIDHTANFFEEMLPLEQRLSGLTTAVVPPLWLMLSGKRRKDQGQVLLTQAGKTSLRNGEWIGRGGWIAPIPRRISYTISEYKWKTIAHRTDQAPPHLQLAKDSHRCKKYYHHAIKWSEKLGTPRPKIPHGNSKLLWHVKGAEKVCNK